MRKVPRVGIQAPEVLRAESVKSKKELDQAAAYVQALIENKLDSKAKAPKFGVYKDKSVALALNSLFFGKCAYCESRFAGMHPVDIEHWRPKGDVFLEDGTPRKFGYYWLAATWENLLPSCIDCNRIRTHNDFVTNQQTTLGKGNWFPLSDEKKRSRLPGDEVEEDPLLLNPCFDEPSQYLEFHENGCVSPKDNLDDYHRRKAMASIRYYALNRTELVQDRYARILLIKQKMHTITKLAEILERRNSNQGVEFVIDDLLAFELQALYGFQKPDQPFSSMAIQLIEPFMERFRPQNLPAG